MQTSPPDPHLSVPGHIAFDRIRLMANTTVAGIWIYQGLVPKLLGPHPDELAMAAAFGVPAEMQTPVSYIAGGLEILFGIVLMALPRRAWPHLASASAMAGLLVFVVLYAPAYLWGAFNPVVMNLASIALSLVALQASATGSD
jgi:nitrate reductase gamma subunit